jgi:hypothetical protein
MSKTTTQVQFFIRACKESKWASTTEIVPDDEVVMVVWAENDEQAKTKAKEEYNKVFCEFKQAFDQLTLTTDDGYEKRWQLDEEMKEKYGICPNFGFEMWDETVNVFATRLENQKTTFISCT